ncbi:MAG: radical SAM protein [Theionarchaea archaeon]|nr:radical SAM protein [Theionarchaea archaeon]
MKPNSFSLFSSIPLGKEYTALLDPETLFWITSKNSKIEEAAEMLKNLYTEKLKKNLEEGRDFLNTSIALDMVELHPTEMCNLNCNYCYIPPHMRKKDKIMSVEEIEIILNTILEYLDDDPTKGMKRVIFHGGEPLIAKDQIFEIIDRYYKDIELGIQTNGTLMTQDDADFLKTRNIHVSFSIDGPPQEAHDALRQYWNERGTFQDVVETISYFNNYFWMGVIVTISKFNVSYICDIARALHKMGVPSSIFNPISPSNDRAVAFMPDIAELSKNYRKLVDTVLELNKENNQRFVVDNIESIVMSLLTSNMRVLYCDMSPCGAGRLVVVITSNGDVYPGSEFVGSREFLSGNIFRNTLEEIFESSPCTYLRSRSVNKIPECVNCPYKYICGANCPAAVYHLEKTLFKKSPYCQFKKELIDYIFYKIADTGLEGAMQLVSNSFEEVLQKSEKLVHVSR